MISMRAGPASGGAHEGACTEQAGSRVWGKRP